MEHLLLPTIPNTTTVITGDEEIPRLVAEEFFNAIISFLGYDDERKTECFTKKIYQNLVDFGPQQPIRTNDQVMMLVVRGILVASVFFWRNEFNNVQVCYAHYLDEGVIECTRWHESEEKR